MFKKPVKALTIKVITICLGGIIAFNGTVYLNAKGLMGPIVKPKPKVPVVSQPATPAGSSTYRASKKEYDDLSVFISNFIESPIKNFTTKPDENDILFYSLMHNYVNNISLKAGNGGYFIDRKVVESTSIKYLGVKPTIYFSVGDFAKYYSDKKSFFISKGYPKAFGFAKVSNIQKVGNNYTVTGISYKVKERVMTRKDIIQDVDVLKSKLTISEYGKFNAVVQRVGGKYILKGFSQ